MKTLKYTKALPGPVLTSALLEEDYDFTTGVAMVSPKDANTILTRLGTSFVELEPKTVSSALAYGAADTGVPVLATATIVGRALQLTFTEDTALQTVAQNALTVKVGGSPVTVSQVFTGARIVRANLAAAVVASSVVSVSYADTAIKDALGNAAVAAVDQAVTNNTPDVTVPVIDTLVIDGDSLVMTYTEDMALHETNKAVPADFEVVINDVTVAVDTVTVDGSAKTVTLAMESAATAGHVVTLSYTKSEHATAYIQDAAGNAAADLVDAEVTNVTA